MKGLRLFILGAAAAAIGLVSLFSPNFVQPRAEAAVIVNTCTATAQVGLNVWTFAGDSVIINVLAPANTGPNGWIGSVSINVTASNTQVVLTFSSDTDVTGYYLVKIMPDGTANTIGFISSNTYVDTNVAVDTICYYKVSAVGTGNTGTGETGVFSDSVAVGYAAEGGVIFNPATSDSTTIQVVSSDDTRVFVRIPKPGTVFAGETDMLKLVVKRLNRDNLPVPGWAKNGVATAYEIYCKRLSGLSVNMPFTSPVEMNLAYDMDKNIVDGTNVKIGEILSRLAIFRWTGSNWARLPSSTNLLQQLLWAQTYSLSYYVVGDVRSLLPPGFGGFGAQPNPFTPNNDGINDVSYFKFENANNEEGVLTVFDLNGAVVYTANILAGKTDAFWDGFSSAGSLVEAGAYIWQAKVGTKATNGIVVIAK